jgi:hypothetical protein
MAIAVAISSTGYDPSGGVDTTRNSVIVTGTLTLTGNYGGASTHGDTVNFAQFDQIKSSYIPKWVRVYEQPSAGTAALGFTYIFCPGTTQANGVLQILSAVGTEISEGGAYSGTSPSLNNAVLYFEAAFPRDI